MWTFVVRETTQRDDMVELVLTNGPERMLIEIRADRLGCALATSCRKNKTRTTGRMKAIRAKLFSPWAKGVTT